MIAIKARHRRETDTVAWGAWHVAALQRTKRLPKLDELVKPARAKGPMTSSQIKAAFDALVIRTGGKLEE